MRLGICYMVFDGEELLEFAVKSIRSQVAHVSVTYQTTSYYGNPSGPDLAPLMKRLKASGLVDELIHYEPDFSVIPKENELRLRNLGLEASRRAGCTHHISSDVDEFYKADELAYAKGVVEAGGYDLSVANMATYYKHPTFRIVPDQNVVMSFIHSVDNEYDRLTPNPHFPFRMEVTRRLKRCDKWKHFSKDEIMIHHMTFVRKNMRKKLANTSNAPYYKTEKFLAAFEKYEVGGRVCIVPDFVNRKTVLVENTFGIQFESSAEQLGVETPQGD